jgi:hypothetical protein
MIERSDSAERIEPKLAKEPMENADANDPVQPMDRNEPTLPIDKTEFLDPIDRIDPSDRIEHQQPCLVTTRVYGSGSTHHDRRRRCGTAGPAARPRQFGRSPPQALRIEAGDAPTSRQNSLL